MADHKAFMRIRRESAKCRPVRERVADYKEVAVMRPDEKSCEQASRCMDCGTPFCHWGCPIGNYIPEWNDLVGGEKWEKALELLDIDEKGLEPQDRRLLEAIIHKFAGGPVGVGTLAAALNEDRGVIEDIYEPYLMTLGFLKRTAGGRMALPAAYEHLGIARKGELL